MNKLLLLTYIFVSVFSFAGVATQNAYAGKICGNDVKDSRGKVTQKNEVKTKIDFGCSGKVNNPIMDLAFALISFLSYGVGVFAVASIVYAGIRYTTSEGNPEKTAAAKSRIQNTVTALMLYIFIFALVQYLVPGGLFG